MSERKSLEGAMKQMAEYAAGLASNWKAAFAADEIADEIQKAGIGNSSIDIAWFLEGGATISCVGRIDRESEMRKIVHSVADRLGLTLGEPKRTDNLKTYGNIEVSYGSIRLRILPDGEHCKRVQVGTKHVPAREEPIFEIVCGEPETITSEEPSKPDFETQDRASFERETLERHDTESLNQLGGYW